MKNLATPANRIASAGFTLVELLLVVTILGILATAAFVNFAGAGEETRVTATRLSINSIGDAIRVFEVQHGRYPESLEKLTEAVNGREPLLKAEALVDSWGTPFTYKREGRRFTITSAGPDLQIGTEDDLTN